MNKGAFKQEHTKVDFLHSADHFVITLVWYFCVIPRLLCFVFCKSFLDS